MSFTPEIGLGYTILRRAALSPERKALTFEGKTSTFGEFGQRIRKLAALLRAGGVCRGDRVGYIGLNHPAFLEALYACSSWVRYLCRLTSGLPAPRCVI